MSYDIKKLIDDAHREQSHIETFEDIGFNAEALQWADECMNGAHEKALNELDAAVASKTDLMGAYQKYQKRTRELISFYERHKLVE